MKLKYCIMALVLGIAGVVACEKVPEGFISDKFTYRPRPFNVTQGISAYSPAIEADGSTLPVKVKLLEIRDKSTGKVLDSNDLAPKEITVYLAELTSNDTTVELLNKKLARASKRPFEIVENGGRMVLSAATEYWNSGRYVFDVQVSNISGTRIIKNAGEIQVNPKVTYEVQRRTVTTSDNGSETNFQDVFAGGQMPMTVERDPAGPHKIIIKFKDRLGKSFNPAKGEVVYRGDRPHFQKYNPYFKEVRTDSTIEFGHPNLAKFPYFTVNGDVSSYYRIPAAFTTANRNVNATFAVTLYAGGTGRSP
ncbi:DUF5007 domain-containing protein [Chitinophaga sedimenti]|uniref:DUF5007 domain-containing protein n=1 Tax=Chitinophaga sedimenti TaxID=2033606 RepID=UPI0020061DF3|nr:DUF5007 domain-containing protein [Chitinophaga sedimenti]MCK7556710.1 DUF5007 domain-containing protein [Chitinophaga sedimenti]